MRRAKGGAPALTAFALETGLSQRYGFTWNNAFRASKGRGLTAVPEKLSVVFSSRRAAISDVTLRLAREHQARHGREPDQRFVLGAPGRQPDHAPSRQSRKARWTAGAHLRYWEVQADVQEGASLASRGRLPAR